MPIEWIYKCGSEWKTCPDGFVGRYNELKEEGQSSAVVMSKEWETKTGNQWGRKAIISKFQRLTGAVDSKQVQAKPTPPDCKNCPRLGEINTSATFQFEEGPETFTFHCQTMQNGFITSLMHYGVPLIYLWSNT